jgi:acyl-homoserine lactone acylase PvdQ
MRHSKPVFSLRPAASSLLLGAALGLAACGSSIPAPPGSGTSGGGSGTGGSSGLSGALGPGDGNSIYMNVMPDGSNGNSAGGLGLPVAGAVLSSPANFDDQAVLYGDISYAQQGLQATPCTPPTSISQHVASSNLGCNYFKHAGLTPDTVASSETLTTGSGGTATIQRDGWGVPFITASNRLDAMFGIGYAMAEDRLWLLDALRNIGRGQGSKFLGPSPLLYEVDAGLAVTAGYSEEELTEMADEASAKLGPLGPMVLQDIDADLAGVNAFIASLSGANASKIPPEYAVLKNGGFPPAPFTRNDVVASAVLIQSLFAVGGGSENVNELMLQNIDPSFTAGSTTVPARACMLWRDIRHANDPDATRTITTANSQFQQSPATLDETCPQSLPGGAAIWDAGSYQAFGAYTANGTAQSSTLPVPIAAADQVKLKGKPGKRQAETMLAAAPQPPASTRTATRTATMAATLASTSAATPGMNLLKALLRQPAAGKSAAARSTRRQPVIAQSPYSMLRTALRAAGLGLPDSMSNWMAITAANTEDGHPIGVMGPQASYYQPQLFWEYSVKSTGGSPTDLVGRGIAFGAIPYILIGRGVDYAWSATSNDSDLVDTRVSKMCNMDGSAPSLTLVNGFPSADGYLYDVNDGNGPQCRRFYKRTDTWTATPTLASVAGLGGSPAPATINRYILRTHYGPVFATATINGAPVAISTQRTTFFGELDTTAPLALASTPTVHGVSSFQHLFNGVTGVFNWLYVDKQDVGYSASGLLPIRDPGQSPDLPAWGDGRYEWANDKNLTADFFSQYGGDVPFPGRATPVAVNGGPLAGGYFEWQNFLPFAAHPQIVNPPEGFIVSWNNSPVPGWWAADSRANWGPIHRVDAEPVRFQTFLATGKKFNFANVEEIMADSGYTDLRGLKLLPLLLQLMQQGTLTSNQQAVVTLMQNWVDGVASDGQTLNGSSNAWINGSKGLGAWRRSRTPGTPGATTYDNQPAVVLMDAWYNHMLSTVTTQLEQIDPQQDQNGLSDCVGAILLCRYDAPRPQGSAYEYGWYQPMYRMLQMVLNTPGHHNYQALKCAGTGVLADCRNAVLTALTSALNDLGGISNMANWDGTTLANEAGDSNATVEKYDAIVPTDLSELAVPAIPWINRPTYQQVVEVQSGR